MEIFVLYRVINHLEIKFLVKYTLVAGNFRAVITQKMCSKVTFSRRLGNNFRTVMNFWMWPECLRKYTFRDWIWTQIFHYFGGNQECYCPLNISYRVTEKTGSNYLPIQGRKNGSLMIRSYTWLGNICPILHDQSSRNKILGKIYVSGW